MAEKLEYQVTDVAGPRPDVYGKRRRVGDTIFMTAEEAVHEISRGVVRLVGAKSADQATDEPEAALRQPETPEVVDPPALAEAEAGTGKTRGR